MYLTQERQHYPLAPALTTHLPMDPPPSIDRTGQGPPLPPTNSGTVLPNLASATSTVEEIHSTSSVEGNRIYRLGVVTHCKPSSAF